MIYYLPIGVVVPKVLSFLAVSWREIEGGGKPHRPFVARYGNDGVHKAFHGGEVLGMPKWGQKQHSTSVGWMALRGLSADAP